MLERVILTLATRMIKLINPDVNFNIIIKEEQNCNL